MRCFLAFPLAPSVREYAATVEAAIRGEGVRGKWVRTANLHLTVLFVGEARDAVIPSLSAALRAVCAGVAPLSLRVGGPSLFGPPPRVLFLECHDRSTDQYTSLARRVRDAVTGCGLVLPDSVLRQTPRPHLTLVRFRAAQEARPLAGQGRFLRGAWVWENAMALPSPPTAPWELASLGLYSSVLRPDGPEYECLAEFPLGRRDTA
jgi:2'-5' RNA ligase